MTYSLEVVQEELLVAREEIAAQQNQIQELLARERESRAGADDLLGALPAAVVVSGATGSIEAVNSRAATLLARSVVPLVGKPLQALVDLSSRQTVRSLVSGALEGTEPTALVQFTALRRPVEVSVAAGDGAGRQRLHWVLREPREDGQRSGFGAGAVAGAVTALARMPLGEVPPHDVLVRSTQLAVEAVDGADWASATLGDPRSPTEVGTSDLEAQKADGVQWAGGSGPTQEAYDGDAVVGAADLHHDPRWPATGWSTTPVRSVLAVPFSLGEAVAGVLTVYGGEPGSLYPGTGDGPAQVVAAATGAALLAARRIEEHRRTAEQLSQAMASRSSIEQAKGVLAAALGCTPEEAFTTMAALSQHRNVKLRDVAGLLLSGTGREELIPLLRTEFVDSRAQGRG